MIAIEKIECAGQLLREVQHNMFVILVDRSNHYRPTGTIGILMDMNYGDDQSASPFKVLWRKDRHDRHDIVSGLQEAFETVASNPKLEMYLVQIKLSD